MKRRRLRVVVTAGPTREHVDPVRYLSNESSGRMGFAIAAAAAGPARRRSRRVSPSTFVTAPGDRIAFSWLLARLLSVIARTGPTRPRDIAPGSGY